MTVLLIIFLTGIACLYSGLLEKGAWARYIGLGGLLVAFGVSFQPELALFAKYQNMYLFTGAAAIFTRISIIVTILLFFLGGFALSSHRSHQSEIYALMFFCLCGAVMLFGYQNLVMLFIGIELLSIPLYVMAGSNKNDLRSNEASVKYFLMGSFATGFLLFGMAIIYGAAGTFDLDLLQTYVISNTNRPLLLLGLVMMIAALAFKTSMVPFHMWSPDVYQGSPSLITAFMASVVKMAAVYAFFRFIMQGFGGMQAQWFYIIGVLVIMTMLVANVMGLAQSNAKRMLAYSSVSHAGYLALIYYGTTENSVNTLAFYLLAYALSTVGAFMSIIYVEKIKRETSYGAFKGLAHSEPILALTTTVSLLSMAGIPLTAGFVAKFSLFSQAMHGGLFLVFIAILGSAISIAYYLRLIMSMYFFQESSFRTSEKVSLTYKIVGVAVIITILALGIYPDFFTMQFGV